MTTSCRMLRKSNEAVPGWNADAGRQQSEQFGVRSVRTEFRVPMRICLPVIPDAGCGALRRSVSERVVFGSLVASCFSIQRTALMSATTSLADTPICGLADVESVIRQLTASWHQPGNLLQNRRSRRMPFQESLCLYALDDQYQIAGPPQRVLGLDISVDGLSFTHQKPLACRYAAIAFQTAQCVETHVARLIWCRYSRQRHYVSGGRFLKHAACVVPLTDISMLEDA